MKSDAPKLPRVEPIATREVKMDRDDRILLVLLWLFVICFTAFLIYIEVL